MHESVFTALGVDEILHPELEAAEQLARRLTTPGLVESYSIGRDHQLLEIIFSKRYVVAKVAELNLRERFQLNLVTIIKRSQAKRSPDDTHHQGNCIDFVYQGTSLEETDVLVLFG